MKLVNQINDSTCVHACLAMVSGKPIEDIIALVGHNEGMGQSEEIQALRSLGIRFNIGALCDMLPGNTHLVTVPSLNLSASNHRIIVHSTEESEEIILDPNEGRADRLYYTTDGRKLVSDNNAIPFRTWSEVFFVVPRFR